MALEKLNIGIVGLGRIADVHFPGYINNNKARIYAVCDTNKELLEKRKLSWKAVKSYTNYEEMLSDPEIDAVEILTPQYLHERMTIEAIQAGKHVALQKPMTVDLQSADRILAVAEKSKLIFRVTDNYCFYPPIVLAKKMIEEGEIGEVTNLKIKFTGGGSGGWDVPASSWEWRMKEKAEGRGIQTFDHGHHLYTTAWYLLGDIEKVIAKIDSADGIIDCPSVIVFKHRNHKASSVITFTHSSEMNIPSDYYANDEWMEITGNKGIIFIHRCTGLIHKGAAVSLFNGKKFRYFEDIKSDWGEGFIGATQNFINSIRGEEKPLLNDKDARLILRASLSAIRSTQQERTVYPEELDSIFPAWVRFRKQRQERKTKTESFFSKLKIFQNTSQYAPQARDLTKSFLNRFDPKAAENWSCKVGVHLLKDKGTPEIFYSLFIQNGRAELQEGELLENPDLVLIATSGIWAAILLGKKKIEMAFLQGKLKIKGKAEEGLKLKSAFKL